MTEVFVIGPHGGRTYRPVLWLTRASFGPVSDGGGSGGPSYTAPAGQFDFTDSAQSAHLITSGLI